MRNTDQQAVAPIPTAVYLLTGCIAIIGSNSLMLGPIAPEVARSFQTDVPAVMTAAAGFGLGTMASALVLARQIDRIGARRMLTLALAVLAAAVAGCALAPWVEALAAAQLIAGLAAGVGLPATYTLAANVAPPGREGETIGIVLTGWTISLVAGVSLAAIVTDVAHWRAVYAALAVLALAAVAVLAASGRRLGSGSQSSAGPAMTPLGALAIPNVLPVLGACAAYMIAFYGTYAYLGDHLHQGLGRSVSANGLVSLAYGIGFGAAAFFDRVLDRLGASRALPLALLGVTTVYLLLAAVSGSYPLVVAVALLWGLANHFGLNVLIMRLTAIDPAQRGAIMGLNSAVTYLALFAGTVAFGPLYESFGFAALGLVAAGLVLAGALLAMRRGRRRESVQEI